MLRHVRIPDFSYPLIPVILRFHLMNPDRDGIQLSVIEASKVWLPVLLKLFLSHILAPCPT